MTKAYNTRSREYLESLGSVGQMEPCDVALIESWGANVAGPILDAGCGPGHWTHLLSEGNSDVVGIDLATEFIASARGRFPGVRFEIMDLQHADFADGSFAGILAWYSMIHLDRLPLQNALERVTNQLHGNGSLLIGFFAGPIWERFPHAVAPAFYWNLHDTLEMLRSLGLHIDEVHTRTSSRHRDHAAVIASKT